MMHSTWCQFSGDLDNCESTCWRGADDPTVIWLRTELQHPPAVGQRLTTKPATCDGRRPCKTSKDYGKRIIKSPYGDARRVLPNTRQELRVEFLLHCLQGGPTDCLEEWIWFAMWEFLDKGIFTFVCVIAGTFDFLCHSLLVRCDILCQIFCWQGVAALRRIVKIDGDINVGAHGSPNFRGLYP